MKKIKISFLLNILVVIICLSLVAYFIFSKDGLRDLIRSADGITWSWIVGALACHGGNAVMDCVLTWQFARHKYKDFSFKDGIKAAVTGHFFSAVTPGGSGGQPMQVYCLNRCGVDVGFASSMLMQKFILFQITATMYAFVLFLFESKFVLSQIKGVFTVWFVAVGFATQIAFLAFLILASLRPQFLKRAMRVVSPIIVKFRGRENASKIIRKVDAKINVFRKSNKDFLKSPLIIIVYFVEIFIQITLIYSVPYFIYKGLVPNGDGSLAVMLCAVAFVNIVASMIPIPGASGASELAFSIFFGAFFTPATLKSAILIWRTITYYLTILIGAPFSITGRRRKELPTPDEVRRATENRVD